MSGIKYIRPEISVRGIPLEEFIIEHDTFQVEIARLQRLVDIQKPLIDINQTLIERLTSLVNRLKEDAKRLAVTDDYDGISVCRFCYHNGNGYNE